MTLDQLWTQNKGRAIIVRNDDDKKLYVINGKTPQGEFVGYAQETGRATILSTQAPDWSLFGIVKPQ